LIVIVCAALGVDGGRFFSPCASGVRGSENDEKKMERGFGRFIVVLSIKLSLPLVVSQQSSSCVFSQFDIYRKSIEIILFLALI